MKNIDIFNLNNTIVKNNQFLLYNPEQHHIEFPYSNYKQIEDYVNGLIINKIGTNCDIDYNFENKVKTYPISLAFDMFVFKNCRIPTYMELVDYYISLSLDKQSETLYKEKDYLGASFVVSYNSVAIRIYKTYFSFIREYLTYMFFFEYLWCFGACIFINREDDYKRRIDIGIIYDDTLYIIDTSLNSTRSNMFETKKINGSRRELDKDELYLKSKYHCNKVFRILLKANLDNSNTYDCGCVKMYKKEYLESICNDIIDGKYYKFTT